MISERGYRLALFAASAEGRDLAPRIAASLGVSIASDVTFVQLFDGDALMAHASRFIRARSIVDIAPHWDRRQSSRSGPVHDCSRIASGALRKLNPLLRPTDPPSSGRIRSDRTRTQHGGKLDLADAPVIVAADEA